MSVWKTTRNLTQFRIFDLGAGSVLELGSGLQIRKMLRHGQIEPADDEAKAIASRVDAAIQKSNEEQAAALRPTKSARTKD